MDIWRWMVAMVVGWLSQGEQDVCRYLQAENQVLREALREARRSKRLLLKDRQRRFLARAAKPLGRKRLSDLQPLLMPDTLLRWHRELVARKYSSKARTGRPAIEPALRQMIIRLAEENESWGYRRIVGALAHLGMKVGVSTVRRVLREAGFQPGPKRSKTLTWKQFMQRQFSHLAAADFFTKEIWTLRGLQRFHVLVVMDLVSRRIKIAGVVPEPDGAWVAQTFRELTCLGEPFLQGKSHLIVDRGTVFTDRVAKVLACAGIQMKRLPLRCPNLNAHVERAIRTIKEETFGSDADFWGASPEEGP